METIIYSQILYESFSYIRHYENMSIKKFFNGVWKFKVAINWTIGNYTQKWEPNSLIIN
jgi:hypothetical protein